ncbi:MAG: metal-sensitive transcriptional regulator [Proteobacteria bacterium]|nr:metal-sensitive transcriptional regulator [Pseudomonadota bacterium]
MHPSHKKSLGNVNRVLGQIEGVKRMIVEEQYCVDIMTQIRAARSALKSIEMTVLETHMRSCLREAAHRGEDEQTSKIEEITALLKRYD